MRCGTPREFTMLSIFHFLGNAHSLQQGHTGVNDGVEISTNENVDLTSPFASLHNIASIYHTVQLQCTSQQRDGLQPDRGIGMGHPCHGISSLKCQQPRSGSSLGAVTDGKYSQLKNIVQGILVGHNRRRFECNNASQTHLNLIQLIKQSDALRPRSLFLDPLLRLRTAAGQDTIDIDPL